MATQSKIMVTDHNFVTGEIIEREATVEELHDYEILKESKKAVEEAEELQSAAKSALLKKLGITKEEAKLLLS